ncbi:Reverse transcriptase (RNA-dependent DNA polymerase) [Popillia japonica]|uniref:RNA-directed DNA polymerase n=1 Tax=Popillia japonica TaxID=7064 RepID=A0AAW1L3Y0_POPJA
MLDLGSQCVMIREADANVLNVKIEPLDKPMQIRGFGEGAITPIGKFNALLKVDQARAETEILVVPNSCQKIPLVIGQPFTEQKHIVLVRKGKNIYSGVTRSKNKFMDVDSLQNFKVPALPEAKINLWAKETCVIPANYVGFVTVYSDLEKSKNVYIENQMVYRKCVPRCIVELDENGETNIPVINVTGREIEVKEDEKMFRGVQCEEVAEIVSCINQVREEENRKPLTREEINLNPNVNDKDESNLIKILNDYRDCFAKNLQELGRNWEYHPQPYRLSYAEREKVRCMVDELKHAGIVVDSTSAYASPILIVKKKTGDERMCVDYRGLNKVTKKMNYPLPIIDDQLDRLTGKCYFTTLDMFSGYYQVPVADEHKHKTAFVTPDGTYEFTKMPFGLVNGPAIFQRLINSVLGSLRFTVAMAYMDDVLIPSSSVEEGLANLEQILAVFRRANLKLNLKKCYFLYENIDYLGFQISAKGIRPGERKAKCVLQFPVPTNVRGVRQFLGLTGFFRRFIKDYAKISKPLTKLLSKSSEWIWGNEQEAAFEKLKQELAGDNVLILYSHEWIWGNEQEAAFEKLKQELAGDNVLILYSHEAYTELHTDASQLGLGAALLQRGPDGLMRPVVYISRQTTPDEVYISRQTTPDESKYHANELETLGVIWAMEKLSRQTTPDESKYHANELETLCVIWAMEKLRVYLIGRPFTIVTDCSALRSTFSKKHMVSRVARWWLRSLEFSFEIRHRPGTQMCHVDALSRNPAGEPEETECAAGLLVLANSFEESDWLCILQKQDSKIRDIVEILNKETKNTEEEKRVDREYEIRDGRLFKKDMDNVLWVVPKRARWQITKKWHDDIGHPALGKTLAKIKENFWWPRMRNYVKGYIGTCIECLYNKVPGGKRQVDGFTKFTMLKQVRNTTSIVTAKVLEGIINLMGAPFRVITDRGTSFTGSAFKKLCREKRIDHVLNATSTARANGQVERINRYVTPSLASLCKDDEHRDWDKHVSRIQWGINNTIHGATKMTPFGLLFNYEPRNIDGDIIQKEILTDQIQGDVNERRQKAIMRIRDDQAKQRKRYNKKRAEAQDYQPGDLVLVRREAPSTGALKPFSVHNPDESDETSDEDYEDSENEQMTMQAEEDLSDGNQTVEPEPPVGPIKPKRERKIPEKYNEFLL